MSVCRQTRVLNGLNITISLLEGGYSLTSDDSFAGTVQLTFFVVLGFVIDPERKRIVTSVDCLVQTRKF